MGTLAEKEDGAETSGAHNEIVLVTGAAGFIGSNLVRLLALRGIRVYGVDNLATGERKSLSALSTNALFTFFEMDVASEEYLKKFAYTPVTHIYHLACPTGVPNIKKLGEQMLAACSTGTKNTLEIARIHGAKIVLSSSAEVYGEPKESPQKETYTGNVSPIGARSAYEEGKRFAEALFKLYADTYGVEAKIARIFNTFGPGMSLNDERVIPHFLKCMSEGKPLRIYGDGNQMRTHQYITDLMAGLEMIMEKGVKGEAYNVGGDTPTTISELADLMLAIAGSDVGIECVPHFIEDHSGRLPSTEKIEKLGWRRTVTLEEGLRRMIPEYLAQKKLRDAALQAAL